MISKHSFLSFSTLFFSLSTIFCCALPIILVTLGLGASFAALTSQFPAASWLAQNATILFITTAILLTISGYFIFFNPQSCPADKKLANICNKTRKINKIIWISSLVILLISLFFKYILILII